MQRNAILAAVLCAAAGCTSSGTGDGIDPTACNAPESRSLIGQNLADLTGATFAAPVTRFINPGDTVTLDVRADRLNVVLDENGQVTDVYCG